MKRKRRYVEKCERQYQAGVYDKILKELNYDFKDKKVLDVGCGAGQFLRAVAKLKPAFLLGVDKSEFFLGLADKDIPVVLTDAQCLPFGKEEFDFVLSNLALPYVEDLEKTIEEIHRVLKPKGRAYLTLHDKGLYLRAISRLKLWAVKGIISGIVAAWTGKNFLRDGFVSVARTRGLLEKEGFHICKVSYNPFFLGQPTIYAFYIEKGGKKVDRPEV